MNISVVIPVLDRQDELSLALQSVYDQHYKPNEIIVIDDGSCPPMSVPSDTPVPVEILRNERSLGVSKSRNVGVQRARSDWIAFLDSDDIWLPEKLNMQVEAIHSDSTLDLVCCDLIYRTAGRETRANKNVLKLSFKDALLQGWTPPNPSTVLINRESFLKLGGFDESLKTSEDLDLWLRLCFSGGKALVLNAALALQDISEMPRLSNNFEKKISGTEAFLNKWGYKSAGWGNIYSRFVFRSRFRSICYAVFFKPSNFSLRNIAKCWPVASLIFNPFFYLRAVSHLVRNIFRNTTP